MNRRQLIGSSGAVFSMLLAGCSETSNEQPENDSPSKPELNGNGAGADDENPDDSEPDNQSDTEPPGDPPLDPDGAWPMANFDARHTGYNPDGDGIRELGDSWRLTPLSPPSVTDETLFTTRTDNEEQYFEYRDPATAELDHEERFTDGGVFGPPTISDDRVFVSGRERLYCFSVDGEPLWEGPELEAHRRNLPVVDGDNVFVSTGDEGAGPAVRCYDASSGEVDWKYELPAASEFTPAVYNGMVYVTSEVGLHAIETDSGEEAFTREGKADIQSPVATSGSVYYFEGDYLVAVEANGGDEQWRIEIDPNRSPGRTDTTLVASSDLIYVGSSEDGLVGLDQNDGSNAIDYGDDGIDYTRDVVPEGRVGDVLYVTERNHLHAFDATEVEHLWTYDTESVTIGDTINEAIYHVTPASNVVYLDAVDGFHGIGSN